MCLSKIIISLLKDRLIEYILNFKDRQSAHCLILRRVQQSNQIERHAL
jgi:hypothetical protein